MPAIHGETCLYANNIITQSAIKVINNRYVEGISSCPVISIRGESPREWMPMLSDVTNANRHLRMGEVTQQNRFPFEKLAVGNLAKKFSAFYERERSLPCSKTRQPFQH